MIAIYLLLGLVTFALLAWMEQRRAVTPPSRGDLVFAGVLALLWPVTWLLVALMVVVVGLNLVSDAIASKLNV